MFTGIVATVGRVETVEAEAGDDAGVRLTIDAGDLGLDDVALGDSIAVNGVCLTVVEKDGARFRVDVSRATLACTAGFAVPGSVNLEKAMRLADRVGGHLVSGHVDGIGEVLRFDPAGESRLLVIHAPADLAKYFAFKGSITVDGVSLTVNHVEDVAGGVEFGVNLIPHTLANTTLDGLCAGNRVNLEIDQIARYVERILSDSNFARR